ncbi:synaptic vesicle membrane protein VAT-1-like [Schistocerca gregaria]|uniref:synaptic vesicle membrane protein VAT-1-like n=1 Tax=Schistocerca gregaria TaxID=7010 RepID=UPI00211F123A|nr:synaptic vesicle membrane protein VAT-1-like [Schistocerca gregaria]
MDMFPLQFTAPLVDVESEENHMVPSVTLNGHGAMNRMKVEDSPLNNALKSDCVEVEVEYCGMNFTDNYLRLGIIRNYKFPVVMGSECCGIVTRVGNAITDLKAGQKVLCLKMQGGLFRRMVHVPRKNCFLVPADISLKDAIGLGLNYLVAHICLFELGCIKADDVIFMQSIAGGVGTAVTQLCQTVQNVKLLGTASESKFADLKSHGVDRVFRHDEDYVQEILKTYPEGIDIIINSNGGTDIERCFKMLKRCGTLILIGSNCTASYPKTKAWGMIRPTWDTQTVSSAELISKNHTVAGVNIGLLLQTEQEMMQAIVAKIFELRSSGKIEPRIHSVLPFEKVTEGMIELCERKNYGKIILDVKRKTATPDEPDVSVAAETQTQPLLAHEEQGQVETNEKGVETQEPSVEAAAETEPELARTEDSDDTKDTQDTEASKATEPVEEKEQSEEKIAEEPKDASGSH